MKRWLTRLIAIAVMVTVCFWLWQRLFPSTEKIIRNRMSRVAKLASFSEREGNIARMAGVSTLLGSFTEDVECFIETPDIPEAGDWTISGRLELRDVVMASRANFGSLKVDFIDVTVTLGADKKTATAELTARVSLPHDKDFIVHEMKFSFRLVNGDWLISRIETVKTLR